MEPCWLAVAFLYWLVAVVFDGHAGIGIDLCSQSHCGGLCFVRCVLTHCQWLVCIDAVLQNVGYWLVHLCRLCHGCSGLHVACRLGVVSIEASWPLLQLRRWLRVVAAAGAYVSVVQAPPDWYVLKEVLVVGFEEIVGALLEVVPPPGALEGGLLSLDCWAPRVCVGVL